MEEIRRAWRIVAENRRAYLTLNAVYYGLTVCAMFFVMFHPELQERLLEEVKNAFQQGRMRAVAEAYRGGHVAAAILLTFVVNLVAGSLLFITLPSLVVPFAGIATGILRATLWGLLLSPSNEKLGLGMIPHSLTLLLEGQAYIVAMFAAYVQGRSFLSPGSVGAKSLGAGYGIGLRKSVQLYVLVVLLLAVSAVYEALEVIYVVPLLVGRT